MDILAKVKKDRKRNTAHKNSYLRHFRLELGLQLTEMAELLNSQNSQFIYYAPMLWTYETSYRGYKMSVARKKDLYETLIRIEEQLEERILPTNFHYDMLQETVRL